MNRDIGKLRTQYSSLGLSKKDLSGNPLEQFSLWFDQVSNENIIKEPNAMTLSTIGLDGYPRARVVLLKFFGENGFGFYTNLLSQKGRAIANNPRVSLSFYWPYKFQQILIKGIAHIVDDRIAEQYFQSRPKGSQLAALLSEQSSVIPNRNSLEKKYAQLETSYSHKVVSKPLNWGGYRVIPEEYEFWQGQKNRLHDRFRYTYRTENWEIHRLAP